MQCDLCGKNINTIDALTYEPVAESKLCRACFDMLSADASNECFAHMKPTSPNVSTKTRLKSIISIVITLLVLILPCTELNIRVILSYLLLFGPSILAALIAYFVSFEGLTTTFKIILILVLMLLVAISSLFVLVAVGFGV